MGSQSNQNDQCAGHTHSAADGEGNLLCCQFAHALLGKYRRHKTQNRWNEGADGGDEPLQTVRFSAICLAGVVGNDRHHHADHGRATKGNDQAVGDQFTDAVCVGVKKKTCGSKAQANGVNHASAGPIRHNTKQWHHGNQYDFLQSSQQAGQRALIRDRDIHHRQQARLQHRKGTRIA